MTNYLIEFAVANFALFAIYLLFLQNESNFRFRRAYLILASLLSLLIPFIDLPTTAQISQINLVDTVPEVILPVQIIITPEATNNYQIGWLEVLYVSISAILALRFILSLFKIYKIYRTSQSEIINNTKVHTTEAISTNFTFLNSIFISRKTSDVKPEIILHEQAHVKYGHTHDLLFLNLMTIGFWWLPTVWLFLKEIKLVHEYQADDFVINHFDFDTYKRTLITTQLSEQGLNLANCFNHNQLSKRIKTMKNMKLKIRSWKLSMLFVSLLMTTYFFACQQQSMTEIVDGVNPDQIGEVMTTVNVQADYPGGKSDLYSYISSNLKYPKEAVKNNIEGKVLVEFVINKDGSISDVSVIKGIGYGCDEEAVRVVESSVNWTPAEHEGEKVRQKLVLPISFRLGNGYSGQKGVDSSTPNYPGGFKAFFQYIQENLKYPSEAKSNNIEGTVHVEFYIEPDGKVTNVKVLRGIGYGCDKEAARVIENSPNWEPTKSEDKTAATKLVIPIQFSAN